MHDPFLFQIANVGLQVLREKTESPFDQTSGYMGMLDIQLLIFHMDISGRKKNASKTCTF